MNCKFCGAYFEIGSKFCTSCGSFISDNNFGQNNQSSFSFEESNQSKDESVDLLSDFQRFRKEQREGINHPSNVSGSNNVSAGANSNYQYWQNNQGANVDEGFFLGQAQVNYSDSFTTEVQERQENNNFVNNTDAVNLQKLTAENLSNTDFTGQSVALSSSTSPVSYSPIPSISELQKINMASLLPEKYAVLSAGKIMSLILLFSIPILGFLSCLFMSFSRSINKRNFARAFLLLKVIIIVAVSIFVALNWNNIILLYEKMNIPNFKNMFNELQQYFS